MTTGAPESNPAAYVTAVVILCVELPETPLWASLQDGRQARPLLDRGVRLRVVESALMLGSLRRLVRLPAYRHCRRSALWHISSRSSMSCSSSMPDRYLEYLRLKLISIQFNAPNFGWVESEGYYSLNPFMT